RLLFEVGRSRRWSRSHERCMIRGECMGGQGFARHAAVNSYRKQQNRACQTSRTPRNVLYGGESLRLKPHRGWTESKRIRTRRPNRDPLRARAPTGFSDKREPVAPGRRKFARRTAQELAGERHAARLRYAAQALPPP